MSLVWTESGQFHTSYHQDERLLRTRSRRVGAGVGLLLVFVVAPLALSEYQLSLLQLIGMAGMGALGLNILTGYTGQISLGHAAFVAVGAYTTANLAGRAGLPITVVLPAAGLAAGLVSLPFGIASLRIKGVYLAMATLAAQYVIEWVLNHWRFVTGGFQTTLPVPPAYLGLLDTSTVTGKYFLTTGLLVLGMGYAANLFRTRTGRAFIAIRDRDLAAAGVGIAVFRYKLLAFFVSSFYAGLTGALWGYSIGLVTIEYFPVWLSVEFVVMILIGGLGSIPGSLLGAAFVTLLPIALREGLPAVGIQLGSGLEVYVLQVLFGVVVILFLILEPGGLYRLYTNVRDYFRMWPFSY